MKQIIPLARKELESTFGSPMALIFLGTFLAATLFAFFWVEAFFARGIADIRPLFRWMPVLTIFLVAALTMRQWSEEQRSGTLEVLLTLPVHPLKLVVGKFLAVMGLIGLALALTLPIPITVSFIGNLDWGPVVGGYLAAILLAAAYVSIGLFTSSRTDNQIVALITTVIVGGVFYMVGASGVTNFIGGGLDTILRAIGTGSRFESIQRGVIDLRDLIYYLSLTLLFLALNAISLDSKRWSTGGHTLVHRRNMTHTAVLLALNLALLNTWLYPLFGLRVDLTEYREYSLSQTTIDLVSTLQEPLLIRAYISEKTHPLLAPLAPQIGDMLHEYAIVSRGQITAEVIDPTKDPEIEAEAAQAYGISPSPFQVTGRYESSVINSYFDILVRYGDQNVVLGFQDLIEVEQLPDGSLDVRLRSLEYDLTRAIKKVVYGFQSVDAILDALGTPARLTLFVTPDTLPSSLQESPGIIQKVASDIQESSRDKFRFQQVNPDAPDSPVTRQYLYDTYGLQPIAASFFSDQSFYLYMLLEAGDSASIIYPPGDLTEATVRSAIESALKRGSPGFLKVVGLWHPSADPQPNIFGQMEYPISSWDLVAQQLSADYTVRGIDLSLGAVPPDVDVLLVIAPQNLDDAVRFAIDQFLMRGGSLIVAAGNYVIGLDPFTGGLALNPVEDGLREMLASYGVNVQEALVMDPQNEPFPVNVTRQVSGYQVQEIQALDYPFFVDVRQGAMEPTSPLVANLSAVTMNWVSPVELLPDENAEREAYEILHSTTQSWLRTDLDIQPNFETYGSLGFRVEGEQQSYPLAVSVQGTFESFFKGKPSPLDTETGEGADSETPTTASIAGQGGIGTIETSPDSARLVVIGSAEFVDDVVLNLSAQLTRDRYLSNLQFLQNTVDWSAEDLDLLGIRARGTYNRVLKPLTEREQAFWEAANYIVALLALLGIGTIAYLHRSNEVAMELPSAPDES